MEDDLDQYQWAERGDIMAVSVCAVAGLGARDALDIVGSFGNEQQLTFAEAEQTWALDATPIQVDAIGRNLILIEPNGWRCTDSAVVARLSAAGKAATFYWNVNSVMRFVYGENGLVVREFDPLLYEPRDALPEEKGLPFGWPGRPQPAAFMLLERLMGTTVRLEWLTQPSRPTHWVNPDPRQ
jgi:hypothetical protein